MSVEAISWALNAPIRGTQKVVLLGLANHARADLREARPAISTLARYANCNTRTVQRGLRALERDGWITAVGRYEVGGRADRSVVVYDLTGRQYATPSESNEAKEAPENGATIPAPNGATIRARGDNLCTNGATLVPPEPSIGTVLKRERTRARASARQTTKLASKTADQSKLPDGLPEHLVARVPEVLDVLTATQAERGGNVPTIRGVGLAIRRWPDRDHLAVARDLEQWALAGNGRNRTITDWSATFGTFCGHAAPASPAMARMPARALRARESLMETHA